MVDNRDRVFWDRSVVVAALLTWDRDFVPLRYVTPKAVFRALFTWPLVELLTLHVLGPALHHLADLADWLSRTGQQMPRFLGREHLIEAALDRERTDTSIEADPSAVRAPGKIIAKNRVGPAGKVVRLRFDEKTIRFAFGTAPHQRRDGQAIRAALAAGKGIRKVAKECRVGISVVQNC